MNNTATTGSTVTDSSTGSTTNTGRNINTTSHCSTTTPSTTFKIDTINSIPDPEQFYHNYIYPRQPVLLSSTTTATAAAATTTTSALDKGVDVQNLSSTNSDATKVVPKVVPIILENPTILQYSPFIEILQGIIEKFSHKRCNNDDDNDELNEDRVEEDHDIEQYENMEVNVRRVETNETSKTEPTEPTTTTTTTRTTNAGASIGIHTMPFHDIYQKIFIERNELYYITTQTLPYVFHNNIELGQPDVMTFLTKQIGQQHYKIQNHHHHHHTTTPTRYIPLRPKLFGQLIPMNIGNIWIGCTSANSHSTKDATTGKSVSYSYSSGLHHDYHDNLYCLIHGSKVIKLAPPESIFHMEMMGTLHTLHPNGRIVYHEQILEEQGEDVDVGTINTDTGNDMTCPIRPDGALVSVEEMVQLEIRKEEIEMELSKHDTTKKVVIELEDELDQIEEQLLDIEMNGNPFRQRRRHDDDDDNSEEDDESEEEEGIFFGSNKTDTYNISSSSSSNHKKATTTPNHDDDDDNDKPPMPKKHKFNISDPHQQQQQKPLPSSSQQHITNKLPPNFVKHYDPTKVLFQTITMRAGDALYIPAGWFHEVTSIGDGCDGDDDDDEKLHNISNNVGVSNVDHNASTKNITSGDTTATGIHMAINYWYHPPDIGHPEQTNFQQPYLSKFWQRDWDQRQLDM